jgi:hypothetical protein
VFNACFQTLIVLVEPTIQYSEVRRFTAFQVGVTDSMLLRYGSNNLVPGAIAGAAMVSGPARAATSGAIAAIGAASGAVAAIGAASGAISGVPIIIGSGPERACATNNTPW